VFGEGMFYDLIVCFYALSVLCYFFDFIHHDRRANRAGFRFLTLVWFLQTAFFVFRMVEKDYLPVITQFETLFLYSWLLVTFSLVINTFFRLDFFVFFTNVIGFAVMVLNFFSNSEVSPHLGEMLTSHLLFIHVALAFFSYAAFSVSGIFALMYLLEDRLLKEKKWSPLLRRLPSLGQLETYSFLLVTLGVPILLLSLILGLIWAYHQLSERIWYDPKVILSFVVLFVYSVILYGKVMSGWYGKKLALWNIGAFLAVILNYLMSGHLSVFHQWF